MNAQTSPLSLYPAALVALRRGNEVLLQRRRNTGYMDDRWALGIGGKVEHGESVIDTAVREAAEEVGVSLERQDLTLITVMHCTDGTRRPVEQRVNWFFECRRWEGTPRVREPHKCSELRWFPLPEMPSAMPPHEARALALWSQGDLPLASTHGFEDYREGVGHAH